MLKKPGQLRVDRVRRRTPPASGEYPVGGPYPTLYAALDRYRREVVAHQRDAARQGRRVSTWQDHWLAAYRLEAITLAHMQAWRNEGLARGRAPDTLRLNRALLSALFEYARREWRWQVANPARELMLPACTATRRRLHRGEEEALVAACAPARRAWLVPIIRLALGSAMRGGEIARLHGDHVDLERRLAHLPMTKNGRARTVPLTTAGRDALAALAPVAGSYVLRPDLGDRERVRAAVSTAFRVVADRIGAQDLNFHCLRHEAISRLYETTTLNDREIMMIVGHSSTTQVARYAHLRAWTLVEKLA